LSGWGRGAIEMARYQSEMTIKGIDFRGI